MAKKKKQKNRTGEGGVVYSTNPDFAFGEALQGALGKTGHETLYISRDKKGRGGKVATLVEGFEGSDTELVELGKWLKQQCGVGGSAKAGEIIIQGDKRDRVAQLLQDKGYKTKFKGG